MGSVAHHRLAALVCLGTIVLGCAGDGDESGSTPGETSPDASAPTDGDLFTERASDDASDDASDGASATPPPDGAEPVVESIPPVAETGVPGIDSDDAFCRAWSEYAGSVQALSLAWAVQPAPAAATLEVAASAAVADAVIAMSDELPSEIESNRAALTVDVPGPFLRRAERARAALVDAGATDAEIEQLGDAWIAAITAAGLDAEDVEILAPEGTRPKLDEAAAAFVEAVPSVLEDPTLDTTEFDITPALDYIFDTCPDRGTLAGNDVTDG